PHVFYLIPAAPALRPPVAARLYRPAPGGISPLSLHDALPIWEHPGPGPRWAWKTSCARSRSRAGTSWTGPRGVESNKKPRQRSRSEEHTSELQSRFDLVCRLLLEKKKGDATSARAHLQPRGGA